MNRNKEYLSAEGWAAIAASLTAVIALSVAVWEGCETRRHNRLTVRPQLVGCFVTSENPQAMGISIKNAGTGPALITNMTLYVDGHPVENKTADGWMEAARKFGIFESWVGFRSYPPTMATGDEFYLLEVTKENQTPDRVFRLRLALSHYAVELVYTSIYGETFLLQFSGWRPDIPIVPGRPKKKSE